MCQLNVYCVPKSVEKKVVINILNEIYGENSSECLYDNEFVEGLSEKYNFYVDSKMRCDCGSVVSRFEGENISWELYKNIENNKEYNKLIKIKSLMESENYEIEKERLIKRREELWDELVKTELNINKIEDEIVNEIMNRNDLTEKEKENLIENSVPIKLNELIDEHEKNPKRIAANESYRNFGIENKEMFDSFFYVKDIKEASKFIKDDRFYCNYVDYALAELKNYLFNYVEKEYKNFVIVMEKILKITNELKILSFWQDESSYQVYDYADVFFNNLKIEDIVFLKYNKLLTIRR